MHFLLLGVGLFLAYGFVGMRAHREPGSIVVTQGKIQNLVATFARTRQRPPTQEELGGLIRDYVREEVAAREAIALGLDRDDTIIRRRLRQKLEFLSENLAAQAEPTDEDLRAYLNAHPEAFAAGPRVTFSHVYLNPERRRDGLTRDATQMLDTLARSYGKVDLSGLGDPFLLDHDYTAVSVRDIAKDFGQQFAAAVENLPVGQWQGPLESGYGLHLVLVRDRAPGRVPALAEVRDAVRRDWSNARRLEAKEMFYHALLQRYTVTVERAQQARDENKVAEARR